jgi:hypothetical protein
MLRRLWLICLLITLTTPAQVLAKTFACGAGDVSCLIASITEANGNGQQNTIALTAGTYKPRQHIVYPGAEVSRLAGAV